MGRYLDYLFRYLAGERGSQQRRVMQTLIAAAVIVMISRAFAESLELFPWSVHPLLAKLGIGWAVVVAPYVDAVYSSLGYPLTPDPLMEPEFPREIDLLFADCPYPLHSFITPVWVFSLWSFTLTWTLVTWLLLTAAAYALARALGGSGSFKNLLMLVGIALIPAVNWWFYVGSETMYEILPQRLFLRMFPPFSAEVMTTADGLGGRPNVMPLESYWDMWGIGFACLVWSGMLIYAFIGRETRLNRLRGLLASTPWLAYFGFLVIGSLNVYDIVYWLRRLGAWEMGYLPLGALVAAAFIITLPRLSKIDQRRVNWQRWRWLFLTVCAVIYFWSIYPYPFTLERFWGNAVIEWLWWWVWFGVFLTFLALFMGRVACGWWCPYAIFHEVSTKLRYSRVRVPEFVKKYRWHIFFTALMVTSVIEIFWEWDFFMLYPRMYTILAIGLAFLWVPRAWCRYLCVLGAYAQAYSYPRKWGIKVDPEKCKECKICACSLECQSGVDWDRDVVGSRLWVAPTYCWLCFNCVQKCPYGAVSFGDLSKAPIQADV